MKISFNELSFAYSKQEKIINNLSFEIKEKSINLIIGASGSGKSSLLSIISGVITDYYSGKLSGEMLFDNQEVEFGKISEKSDQIGFVFQDPNTQFCTSIVRDELAFGLENMLCDVSTIEEEIIKTIKLFDIEDLLYSDLENLSGGQKQIVALASVYIMKPKVILMDEPTANLDPSTRKKVFNLVKEFKKNDITVIIVEHHIDEVYNFIDYVHIIKDGTCLFSDIKSKADNFFLTSNLNIPLPNIIYQMKKHHIKPPFLNNINDFVEYLKKQSINYNYKIDFKKRDTNNIYYIENLNASYNEKNILHDLTFEIRKEDFIAILGKNGAGKSTLLNCLLNLKKIDSGKILINDKSITDYSKKEFWQKIGISFQNPEWQFVKNTVYEEMMYILKKAKLSKKEKNDKVIKVLKQLKLDQYCEVSPFLLSQGEKRRLSVALLLLEEKEILFFDEPTFGQDKANKIELMNLLTSLNNDGMTIVIISHDMQLVYDYCNHVLVIDDGRVLLEGNPDYVFSHNKEIEKANLAIPFEKEVSLLLKNI